MYQQLEPLTPLEQDQLKLLRKSIKEMDKVLIAYSGGVDSSLVAAIANEQLGSQSIAVTGVSPALATDLLYEARLQADWMGIEHQECKTNELNDPAYYKNPNDRCFACKKELHQHLISISKTKKSKGIQVVDGINHDDLKDHRPGIEAAKQAGVRSPLAELMINKNSIRHISKALGFPWWDKPAQPCLASRFPYGETITAKRLIRVNQAEKFLKELGLSKVRVRSQGLAARIEIESNQLQDFMSKFDRDKIVDYLTSIGFTSVSLDLEGLISGKLNRDIK